MEIKKMKSVMNFIFSEGPNKNFPEFLFSRKMKSKRRPIMLSAGIQCFEDVLIIFLSESGIGGFLIEKFLISEKCNNYTLFQPLKTKALHCLNVLSHVAKAIFFFPTHLRNQLAFRWCRLCDDMEL